MKSNTYYKHPVIFFNFTLSFVRGHWNSNNRCFPGLVIVSRFLGTPCCSYIQCDLLGLLMTGTVVILPTGCVVILPTGGVVILPTGGVVILPTGWIVVVSVDTKRNIVDDNAGFIIVGISQRNNFNFSKNVCSVIVSHSAHV